MAIKTIRTCRKNKQIQSGNDLVVDKIGNISSPTKFYLAYTVRNLGVPAGPKVEVLTVRERTKNFDLFSKIINFDAAEIFLLCQHFTGANRRMFSFISILVPSNDYISSTTI